MQKIRKYVLFVAVLTFNVALNAATYSSGSGCAIASNHVLTAYHVVKGAEKIYVEFQDVKSPARIEDYNESLDWAILRINNSVSHVASLHNGDLLNIGDKIYTLGYPTMDILGKSIKYSEGVISAIGGINGNPNVIQISAPIQPGSSGGPVFSNEGHLIGLVTSTMNPSAFMSATKGAIPQNINFALRLPTFMNALAQATNITNAIEIKHNELSTCLIISVEKTKIPLCKFKDQSDKEQVKEEFQFYIGGRLSNDEEVKAKAEKELCEIREYLKGFRPDCCHITDERWGPITNDKEYYNQVRLLDDLYLRGIELHEKGFINSYNRNCYVNERYNGRTYKNPMKDCLMATDWYLARERAAQYFAATHAEKGIAISRSLLGVKLGEENSRLVFVRKHSSLAFTIKRKWKRLKHRIDVGYWCPDADAPVTASIAEEYAKNLSARLITFPENRVFFGCDYATIIEDQSSKRTLAMVVYLPLEEDFFNVDATKVHEVLNTVERKFNFKFYPFSRNCLMRANVQSRGDEFLDGYDGFDFYAYFKEYKTKYPNGISFYKEFSYKYEQEGVRILADILLDDTNCCGKGKEPTVVLRFIYFLKDWKNVVEQSLKVKEESVRRNYMGSDGKTSGMDFDAL